MAFKFRPVSFVYYKLFFVVLTFIIGFACLFAVALEFMPGWSGGVLDFQVDRETFLSTFGVAGMAGLCGGLLMLYLMKERRTVESDRRKKNIPIDFPERRISPDRRYAS